MYDLCGHPLTGTLPRHVRQDCDITEVDYLGRDVPGTWYDGLVMELKHDGSHKKPESASSDYILSEIVAELKLHFWNIVLYFCCN